MTPLAFTNTRILLNDGTFAEALLVEDGRITDVGTTEAIEARMPEETRVHSLPGRLVTPGLVDAHCHLVSLGHAMNRVRLFGKKSLAECKEEIRKAAEPLSEGQWLIGRGWNHLFWDNPEEPTRRDLDDLVPDNPAVMIRACGHAIWVNTKALEVAGLTADTPEPPDGQIDREPDGFPTGLIRESRALVEAHIPAPTIREDMIAARNAQELALSLGITGVHSCEGLPEYRALLELERLGELKLRVNHLLPPEEMDEANRSGITPATGSDHLWHTHVKLFADGSLGAETALLHEPYASGSGIGIACLTPEELLGHVRNAYENGRSVAIHAIGDLAVTHAIDAIETARTTVPGNWRDRIEHVQLICKEDIKRMRNLDITASVQPGFLPTDWKMAEAKWGDARCKRAYIWKTLKEAGIRLQFGSDTPVEPNDPRIGIRAAFERCGTDGLPEGGWRMEEALPLSDSILGYVETAAWTSGQEAHLGGIRKGAVADFTLFAKNPFETGRAITTIPVDATFVAGRAVFCTQRETTPPSAAGPVAHGAS